MPAEGIEPTRSCDHWILSPARLPVPPRRREKIKLQKRSGSSSVRNNAWRPSHRFENEIRRLNTAWRTKNFPQNNRCARRVWGTQSLFPNCVGRCADARLIICSRDSDFRRRTGLRLLWRDPHIRLVSFGRNNRRNNDALDFRRRNFRGLLQHHDFLCLLPPGAEWRFGEGPH